MNLINPMPHFDLTERVSEESGSLQCLAGLDAVGAPCAILQLHLPLSGWHVRGNVPRQQGDLEGGRIAQTSEGLQGHLLLSLHFGNVVVHTFLDGPSPRAFIHEDPQILADDGLWAGSLRRELHRQISWWGLRTDGAERGPGHLRSRLQVLQDSIRSALQARVGASVEGLQQVCARTPQQVGGALTVCMHRHPSLALQHLNTGILRVLPAVVQAHDLLTVHVQSCEAQNREVDVLEVRVPRSEVLGFHLALDPRQPREVPHPSKLELHAGQLIEDLLEGIRHHILVPQICAVRRRGWASRRGRGFAFRRGLSHPRGGHRGRAKCGRAAPRGADGWDDRPGGPEPHPELSK
mmetsp:Transcript_56492/g.162121  ORF Transcript_56492/g.162121 Transcript_56492/m.162121 type:complete len:350 (-) Transcript_56492:79-1128(-)